MSGDLDDFLDAVVEDHARSVAADETLNDLLYSGREDYTAVPWLDRLLACRACPARDEARRVVPGSGPLDARIAVVGQNPDEAEDEMGVAFVGRAGQELDVWLDKLGLDRAKVLVTNALKCHTARNRKPRPKEMSTCRDLWFREELETFHAVQVLIPLGRPALESLFAGMAGLPATLPPAMDPWWMEVAVDAVGGDRRFWVMPLPHPNYILRAPNLRPRMYEHLLPAVKSYLRIETPEAYARSRRD